jgi:hypothetical protein
LFLYLTFSFTSLSLSHLKLPNLFISSINCFTFSSTSLSFSSLELPDLFISPINCTPNSFLNPMLRFFLVSSWFLWFYYCFSLKGVFFPFWFLIGFTRFHTFTYFFIWFFVLLKFFFFGAIGVICSVGFMPFFFLTLKLKLCFSCTTGTQFGTSTPLFCLALNTKPFQVKIYSGPEYSLFAFFFFLSSNQDSEAKIPFSLFVLYLLNK